MKMREAAHRSSGSMLPAVIPPFGRMLVRHALIVHVFLMAGLATRGLARRAAAARLLRIRLSGTLRTAFMAVLWIVFADHCNLQTAAWHTAGEQCAARRYVDVAFPCGAATKLSRSCDALGTHRAFIQPT
ncbi:hypothetical protein [Stenotrophomonas sp.]|uniref:hypothetical protein n=1 Tax=Stenotrophomonas sp. TaxID=69392 RepID=UPI0028AF97F7|nr:hypothetical protein [Stenotrophomonas sp.]